MKSQKFKRIVKVLLFSILLLCPFSANAAKIIVFDKTITEASVDAFLKDFRNLDATPGVVFIELNSPGGLIMEAMRMGSEVAKAQNATVCITTKQISSAAPLVLPACRWRVMTPNAKMLLHEPAIEITKDLAPVRLRFAELADLRAGLQRQLDIMATVVTYNWKLTPAEYKEKIAGRDWVLTATDALSINATDFVMPVEQAFRVFSK